MDDSGGHFRYLSLDANPVSNRWAAGFDNVTAGCDTEFDTENLARGVDWIRVRGETYETSQRAVLLK